jgi:hypothetical protein
MSQLQLPALRRHAVPIVAPKGGLPLIRNTVSLGRMLEWRKGLSTMDEDMPEDLRKRKVYEDFLKFKEWMAKEDGAHFRGKVKVTGPYPHFEPKPNDVQVGDRGGTREVARSIIEDTSGSGKVDYVIEALFDVPEYLNELPTALAAELIIARRPGLRSARNPHEREWREVLKRG